MATASQSIAFRMPALPVANQQYAGLTSVIHTDTETEPIPPASSAYTQVYRGATTPEARSVWVQTAVFRTDYSSAGAQGEWYNVYKYVNKNTI